MAPADRLKAILRAVLVPGNRETVIECIHVHVLLKLLYLRYIFLQADRAGRHRRHAVAGLIAPNQFPNTVAERCLCIHIKDRGPFISASLTHRFNQRLKDSHIRIQARALELL